jgi:uncharacterized LabA/DUF88 family protein
MPAASLDRPVAQHAAAAERTTRRTNKESNSVPHQERVNIAVFIDFDNIEIGVKTTLGEHFDIGTILEALKERGEVVTKIAYADWTRAGEYSRMMTQHAIRLVQRNLTPGGDKNGADINLALDALEMAFTHTHINAFVIVGGDSDFLSLVEKLKQYDKKVFVVGGRAFTSIILQRNCHEFIAYENLVRSKPAARGGRPAHPVAAQPLTQAFPIVRRALKILADREVSPQTGLLKSTLLQLDSTFSERTYGASSFLDFVEKLAQSGLVQLKHAGRSVMVELNTSFDEGDAASAEARAVRIEPEAAEQAPLPTATAIPNSASPPPTPVTPFHAADHVPEAPLSPLGDPAEGVRVAGRLLAAARTARWPMYLRNVKQILRAGAFDERRYGLGGLLDLLRACQREGLVRMERDRRGGLRVFQGSAFDRQLPPIIEAGAPAEPAVVAAAPIIDVEADETVAAEIVEVQPPEVVDTTAELLGRAKPKRTRLRQAAAPTEHSAAGRPSRRGSNRKTATPARRPARAKRNADARDESES